MNQYGNSIFRLAYSYLHHMEDAEDLLQETLIRYMKKAPAFESPDHEKAWLLHVAANLAKNKIKYNNVRKTDELKEELEADKEEDLSFVWDAVTKLSVDQRSVIHLFYQEGYSTAQIAGLLEMKESTVRSHLKRGRDHLRSILKEEYDFE
ncbi:MAG TPA: RNA polymerase subunit sigma-70 [Lachnospiraceae bacterium]|nr:RNA polymerase subunit sigma-70 [Lachnospiraceae bacterium]